MIQFPRLIAEIAATQPALDMQALADSMDLEVADVDELFERAEAEWEVIKKQHCRRPKPVYYECGICDHCHPWGWNGDCRDDANRLTCDQLDDQHGQDGYELRSTKERIQ